MLPQITKLDSNGYRIMLIEILVGGRKLVIRLGKTRFVTMTRQIPRVLQPHRVALAS